MKKLFIPTLIAAGLSTLILTLPSCSPDERQGSEEPLLELTSPEEMSIPAEGGDFIIHYRITNPTKDGTVTAWTDEDCEWIEDLNCWSSYGEITFNVGKNTSMGERSATVTASYENQTFEVKVTQKWSESALYDIEFEAKDITGFYYGERYSPGMGDYWFFFSDIGFDESNNFSGLPDGTYYRIDAYAPLAEDLNDLHVPVGTYTLDLSESPSCGAFTFSQAMSAYFSTDGNGKMNTDDTFQFIDGTLEVTEAGNGYRMDLYVTTSDGLVRHVYYEGPVALVDESSTGGSQEPDLPPSAGDFPAIEEDFEDVFDRCASVLLGSYSGISEVNVQFTNMDTDINGDWVPPGTALDVHFYTRLDGNYEIAEGTYTCGRGEAGQFRPGGATDIGIWAVYGTYVTSLDEAGNKTVGLVDGGTVTITKVEDGVFSAEFILTMQGGYTFTGSYTGPIKIDASTSGSLSTLTGDYEVDFTQGEIKATANYWGDFYNTGTGNWTIDISPAPGSTQDDTFILDICCSGTGFGDDLSGTYTASTGNEPGTYMPGYVSGTSILGTMYLGGFDSNGYVTKLAPAMSGEVIITQNPDGTHTISFDCMDDAVNPNNFYGSWTGTLNKVDMSSSVSNAKATMYQSVKSKITRK